MEETNAIQYLTARVIKLESKVATLEHEKQEIFKEASRIIGMVNPEQELLFYKRFNG